MIDIITRPKEGGMKKVCRVEGCVSETTGTGWNSCRDGDGGRWKVTCSG